MTNTMKSKKNITKYSPFKDNPIVRAVQDCKRIKISEDDSLKSIWNKFYNIMRKHGIKEGIQSYDDNGKSKGRTICNPEWVICKDELTRAIDIQIMFMTILGNVPEDLKSY